MRTWFDVDPDTQSQFIQQFKTALNKLAETGAVTVNRPISLEERQQCAIPHMLQAAELMLNYKKTKRRGK